MFFITLHIPTEEGGDKTKTKQKRQQWVCRRYMSCSGEMQWTSPTTGLGIGVHSKHHGRGGREEWRREREREREREIERDRDR